MFRIPVHYRGSERGSDGVPEALLMWVERWEDTRDGGAMEQTQIAPSPFSPLCLLRWNKTIRRGEGIRERAEKRSLMSRTERKVPVDI